VSESCSHPEDALLVEWMQPGPGTGLAWLGLRCERCGGKLRWLRTQAPPIGARISEVDWAQLNRDEWVGPHPGRLLIAGVIAAQLMVLALMLALALPHLPH
jgi:hypothetical protein